MARNKEMMESEKLTKLARLMRPSEIQIFIHFPIGFDKIVFCIGSKLKRALVSVSINIKCARLSFASKHVNELYREHRALNQTRVKCGGGCRHTA
jgi:hypothetical protein